MTTQLALDLAPLVTPTYEPTLTLELPDRFWSKVRQTDSCWLWTGATSDGYGRFAHEGRTDVAHRLAWRALVGPIPDGLHIDHLCRVRRCVNPEHLEPVTCRENVLRGIGPSAEHAVKTHCPAGHEYTPENTYRYRNMRMCRACRAQARHRRAASPAAERMRDDQTDARHGSLTGYATYQCRCERCRDAWRAYHADRRAQRAVA